MKKGKCLNREVSYIISQMGHFDNIAIGDAGLPIPSQVQAIDLAVTLGTPSFWIVFETILEELEVQKMTIASEMKDQNTELYDKIKAFAKKRDILVVEVSHERLKKETYSCKAVIRTGECRPYANVILESGVVF